MLPFPDDYYTVADELIGDRQADRPARRRRCPPTPPACTIDRRALQPQRRLQPRARRSSSGCPAWTTPEALAATDPVPLDQLGRYARARRADRRDRRRDRRALADLGRDRLERRRRRPRRALLIHPARNFDSGHRYIVAMRNLRPRRRAASIAAPEGFRYFRDDLPSDEPAINGAARALREDLRDAARGRASGAPTSTSPGTSPSPATRTSPAACCTCATTPSPSSATATMADVDRAGRLARRSPSTGIENFTPAEDAADGPPDHGHLQGALLPGSPTATPGGTLRLGGDGLPTRNGTYTANFNCIVPRGRGGRPGPGAGAPVALRPRAARRRRRGHVEPDRSDLGQPRTGSSSARTDEIGMSGGGRPEHRREHPPRALQVPAARRPAPAGAAQRALPGPADDPPGRLRQRPRPSTRRRHARDAVGDRPERALLQRQQPGRDHGRRADRDRARLHPRRRSACRR